MDNTQRAINSRRLIRLALSNALVDNNGAATTARDIITNLGHYLAANAPKGADAKGWAIDQAEMALSMFRTEFDEDGGVADIRQDGEDHIEV